MKWSLGIIAGCCLFFVALALWEGHAGAKWEKECREAASRTYDIQVEGDYQRWYEMYHDRDNPYSFFR